MRAASDAGLGIVLLTAGVVAIVAIAGMDLGRALRPGPGFFPTAIGWTLLLVGVAELLRAVLLREREDARWSLKNAAIITVVILCAGLAVWQWGGEFTRRFNALEWTALFALVLSVTIALARASRTRATGMVLLGLLLGIVGQDVNTGVARFMFGLDPLADGFSLWAMLLGFAVADGALCVVSPSLLLAIYARKFGLRFAATALPRGSLVRIAGALLIAAALYESGVLEDIALIGQITSFAAFGLACQLLGWNRLVLLVACLLGPLLEENIRRAGMIAGGDPAYLLSRPIEGTMLVLAVAILTIAVALSAWRTIRQLRPGGMMREAKPVESK